MNATNNPYAVTPPTDTTLTQEGVAADAKVVGDELSTRTVKYFGRIADTGETNSATYDMNGKPGGLYMVCFFRSNKIFILFMKNDNALEWTGDSNAMTITGTKVTFKDLNWYDSGNLFRLA